MLKEENPVRGVKLFHEEKRERFLTAEEIARLNQALMSEPDWRWRAFFPLSLLLGTRRGELAMARRTLRLPRRQVPGREFESGPGSMAMTTFPILPSGSTICVAHWEAGWQRAVTVSP